MIISLNSINFEIPNYQVSGLRVKGLAVDVADKNYNAYEFEYEIDLLVIVISVILHSPTVIVAVCKCCSLLFDLFVEIS